MFMKSTLCILLKVIVEWTEGQYFFCMSITSAKVTEYKTYKMLPILFTKFCSFNETLIESIYQQCTYKMSQLDVKFTFTPP